MKEDAARSIMAMRFDPAVQERMEALTEKAKDEILTREEETELDICERFGNLLGVLQAKASSALRSNDSDSQLPHDE